MTDLTFSQALPELNISQRKYLYHELVKRLPKGVVINKPNMTITGNHELQLVHDGYFSALTEIERILKEFILEDNK